MLFQVVAAKHMDTVAVTFREGNENRVLYLDEQKGEPVPFNGKSLDAASLDDWVKELLMKSEPWCETCEFCRDFGNF